MRPPTDRSSSEADEQQLALAREHGEAYGRGLKHMVSEVAEDGGEQAAGPYLVGRGGRRHVRLVVGELQWQEPARRNVEIAVRGGADGRFVPRLRVGGTLISPEGEDRGPHEHPLLRHAMLYHYGRNRKVPGDGKYMLHVTSRRRSSCVTTRSTASASAR